LPGVFNDARAHIVAGQVESDLASLTSALPSSRRWLGTESYGALAEKVVKKTYCFLVGLPVPCSPPTTSDLQTALQSNLQANHLETQTTQGDLDGMLHTLRRTVAETWDLCDQNAKTVDALMKVSDLVCEAAEF